MAKLYVINVVVTFKAMDLILDMLIVESLLIGIGLVIKPSLRDV
ncbi:hypothetical protein [Vibrio echinoideorum]|nr:hypothetical protein [Vibrio echinoideorum]